MPLGIGNITTVTLQNLTDIANVTDYAEFNININHIAFGGWFWFIMMWLFWFILFISANKANRGSGDQLLPNMMYSMAAVSVVSFFMRVIKIVKDGVEIGLLSDWQMWMFPVITIALVGIIWATKKE